MCVAQGSESNVDLEKEKTAISQHISNCNACFIGKPSLNNFDILKKCNSNFDTMINEALHIQLDKPKLNSKLFNSGKSFLLNIYN